MVWAGVWAGAGASLCLDVQREVLPKRKPIEPDRTKNKERTRKEKLVLFGWYPVYALPFRRHPVSAVPFGRYPVSAVPFGPYRELAVLFWRY